MAGGDQARTAAAVTLTNPFSSPRHPLPDSWLRDTVRA